jgi:hypothetical protein
MDLFQRPEEVSELSRFFVTISLVLFFSVLFLWPLGWFFRQPRYNRDIDGITKYKPLFTIGRYYSFILVGFSLMVYFYLRRNIDLIYFENFPGYDEKVGFLSNFVISIPSLLACLLPIQVILTVLVLIGKHGTKIFRIQYLLVSIALLVFLLYLIKWNLVFPGYYFDLLFQTKI